jgi:hypothetical protein
MGAYARAVGGGLAVSTAAWTISIIAILIVAVIAWREFGGK